MKNVTVIESPQLLVLYSYSTPVAYVDKCKGKVYRTTTKHSRTTTKHIKRFFDDYVIPQYFSAFNPIDVSQEELDKKFPISVGGF